ncbi:MAG: PASTA domain-containing protein [bacterium]
MLYTKMNRVIDFLIAALKVSLILLGLLCISFISGQIIIKLVGRNELVKVPQLKNKDIKHALKWLNDLDISLEITGKGHSQNVPVNYVLYQDPPAGEFIRRDQTVKVMLSKGAEEEMVPDVTGEPWLTAQTVLKESNLNIGKLTRTHHNYRKNLVVSQNPPGNKMVPSGSYVDILVSDGKRPKSYAMPNITGLTIDKATAMIKYLGLTQGDIKYVFDDSNMENHDIVLSQKPLPGFYVEEKTEVYLVVSKKKQVDKEVTGVYQVLYYKVPSDREEGVIRVIIQNGSEKKEIYKEFHSPSDELELLVKTTEDTVALIYLNDELIEEKQF